MNFRVPEWQTAMRGQISRVQVILDVIHEEMNDLALSRARLLAYRLLMYAIWHRF